MSLQESSLLMEAKALLSGIGSNTTIPSSSITKTTLFPISPSFPRRVSCSYRLRRWISLEPRGSNTAVKCQDRAAKRTAVGADSGGAGRKRLAVFVSGGGSNFRSIYEATLRGSVLGDVVVLVTNKHGSVSLLCFTSLQFTYRRRVNLAQDTFDINVCSEVPESHELFKMV